MMPKVIIKKNTMVNSENDSIMYRRVPTSGFRRDNRVRSSLRMLSNRWKQSTKASLIKGDATGSSELILPFRKWYDDTELKTSIHSEVFIKPKTEIKLELPIDKDLFNRRTSMLLMNSNFKILKRSMSLKSCDDGKDVQRTATIRKGSVWANSTSKINLPGIVNTNFPQKTNFSNVAPKTCQSKPVGKNSNSNMEFLMPYPRQNQPAKIVDRQFASVKKYENTNITADDENTNSNTTDVIHSDFYENNKKNHKLHHQHLHSKMTKKQLKLAQAQLDKLTQINIHLHALFAAVENGHLDKARTILESTDVDVNSLNSDGLSPLDVAVLSNNRSLTKMLLEHGAIEGTQFKNSDSLGNHLNSLLHDAENRIHELGSGAEDISQPPFSTRASFSSIIGNAYPGPSVTGCAGNEADKQIGIWERRVKGLRRMLLGWDQVKPPDPPHCTTIDVTSNNSVTIRIQESTEGAITTKFKIQWSTRCDFSNIVGDREVNEWNSFQGIMGSACRISDLTQGRRYFFRACCGNVKGWGQYRQSIPNSVIPSSWRDIEHKESRFTGRQRILDDLFTAVRMARPEDASEIQLDTPALQRRNPKKKTTIKQLFSAASKFQKTLKRGIYLACILYHEDKVLVTNEDFLPVVEIDENYPSCLHTDYNWLMKVACTWDDVKSLRNDMEKNPTSAVHFRTKLLSAVCQMQSALCIQDLGQLYHKPLRDSLGTIVLSCINNVKSSKSVSVLNSRWIPLNKIQKKLIAIHEDNNINEILLSSIQDQISYHQSSAIKLAKGLYIGYLKMQSSVDQIQIVVPTKTPNVLPHCKIRDNPHISAEEWDFLRTNKARSSYEMVQKEPTDVQELFLEALIHAAHRIFKYMEISPEHALAHRLYNFEVMELSPEVSFLVVCPPAELSCAVPGQREMLLQRGDFLSLPIQVFEMVHLKTYHSGIIQKYSRLSCILELDTVLANHSHREAFSSIEVQAAKERLNKLQDLSKNLNEVWKGARWLMDVISFARDRCTYLGLNMKEILEIKSTNCEFLDEDITNKLHLLQPPTVRDNKLAKGLPGRGSWPGPTNLLGGSGLFVAEHSKSEQQLSLTMSNLGSRYLSTASEFDNSRKNSADSNYSHSGNSYYSAGEAAEPFVQRLPPSRSEDTLTATKHSPPSLHRKRSITVNASMSSSNSSGSKDTQKSSASTTDAVHGYDQSSATSITPTHKSRSVRESVKSNRPHAVENYLERSTSSKSSKTKDITKEDLHISEGDLSKAGSSSTQSGTIQVYAAYETGLASGINLKLHVTTATTAREVIDLVVKQLNMAVVLKGKDGPIYTNAKLENFCLVAVIGARERCLRDDFKPLQLQNPWKKGRLYVRQKHELLAAIEHSNRDAQLI
ncbi:hypothetical protein HA402_003694 [Bradysia odoriphaga]|nr:hypothetical protein HA402_003694 [Bradysia odoriphaga]